MDIQKKHLHYELQSKEWMKHAALPHHSCSSRKSREVAIILKNQFWLKQNSCMLVDLMSSFGNVEDDKAQGL